MSIAKCKPGSINALATLVEAFKKSGETFGLLGIVTLLLLALAALTLLLLYSMERHQKKRAREKLGFYQRAYEAMLGKGNTSSGINSAGSTPKLEA